MATEDIKVQDGHIIVERAEHKDNVDVVASDVDSITFTRGVMGGTGALVLHTTKGDVLIRVENDDANDAVSVVRSAVREKPAEDQVEEESGENVKAPVKTATPVARRK